MKKFSFKWHKNEKYSEPLTRFTEIIAVDAKSATEVFMANFGNLKKNTIESIQEFNEHGPVGDPIVPEN